MVIDPNDKNRVKELFSSWMENKDQVKQINDNNKDLVKDVSDILNVKTKTVNKLFTFLKQRMDNGEDEIETLSEIITSIEN